MTRTRWIIVSLGILLAGFAWLPPIVQSYLFLPGSNHHNDTSIKYEIVATNLRVPWDIVFPSPGEMLISERPGTLYYHKRSGKAERIPIEETAHIAEGGLLGLTLHPLFDQNHWLYLYVTRRKNGKILNDVLRYQFENGKLSEQTTIVKNIPGAPYHDGGRIAFGPDGYLYITTGDAGERMLAQDTSSLAGKILRVKDDGSIPAENPFGNAIWSYGHRNPQGITWDTKGNLWSTEHGPSGMQSGYDELNLIVKGGNYGWPLVQGNESREGLIRPILHAGADTTWGPASALYWDGSLFFGGLLGQTLYEAPINQGQSQLKRHLVNELGRLRTVVIGPDGYFYITTSNTDGRGFPKKDDDKIIRINPREFR